jgi:hypothetical protein
MAISGISASGYTPDLGISQQSQIFQAFSNLIQALQSDDVARAQRASNTLTALMANRGSFSQIINSEISQSLSQVGGYVGSGNLTGAEAALTALLEQLAQEAALAEASAPQATTGGNGTVVNAVA